MTSLRSLLRLDDKMAAEGRRLQRIGGPPMRWVAAASFAAAVFLHAAALLLPATRLDPKPPRQSLATSFPLVWRPDAPAPMPSPPTQASAAIHAPQRAEVAPAPGTTEPTAPPQTPPAIAQSTRRLAMEPVPEPAPDLSFAAVTADIDVMIPNPDAPPDSGPSVDDSMAASMAPISSVRPVYPPAARTLRAEGEVRLRLFVRTDGTVDHATVEACTHPGLGFETAALAAVKQWRYEPTAARGAPRTPVVTIHFRREGVGP